MQINLVPLCVVGTGWEIIKPIVTQQAAILIAVPRKRISTHMWSTHFPEIRTP